MVHAFNASAKEAEAEGWLVQGYAGIHSKMVWKNSGGGPLLRTKYLGVNVESERTVKFKGRLSLTPAVWTVKGTLLEMGVGAGGRGGDPNPRRQRLPVLLRPSPRQR